jgi:putative transposase
MTNHAHLLLTPAEADGASLLMKHLGQRYVQHVNRTLGRSGTLWEGRFKSCLVQTDAYVLACYRYIEMNPVRAGMTPHPGAYRWSSYRFNVGDERSTLIVPHETYLALAGSATRRSEVYRELMNEELDANTVDAIRAATGGNVVLGTVRFQEQVERALGRRAGRGVAGRPRFMRQ